MTQVLITGSEGFIGKKTVLRFQREGYDVYTLDLQGSGEKHFAGDISSFDLDEIFKAASPEIVIHTAAQTDVMTSFRDPENDFLTNSYGTLRLMSASKTFGVKTFIYIHSGGAVYDSSQPMPLTERSVEKPVSPYGISKQAGENYVQVISTHHGINWASLALSNVYGDVDENPKGVIFEFWKRLTVHEECQINGSDVTRDFIHVDDVVDSIYLATLNPPNSRINISSGTEISLLNLYELICDCMEVSQKPKIMKPRNGEVLRSCLSNKLAKELLGWEPKVSISSGISRALLAKEN
jgi:UDP-glucose 4-epimerase